MTVERVDFIPRFTQYLIDNDLLIQQPLHVVDVGARDGFESHWLKFADNCTLSGFEPDALECAQINQGLKGPNKHCFPYAIWSDEGTYPLYKARFPASSGVLPAEQSYIERHLFQDTLAVCKEFQVECISIDFWSRKYNANIDFIKVDVEGGEYFVLKGAADSLKNSVIACNVETWIAPVHRGQVDIGRTISLMKEMGFELYDMDLHHYPKSVLPETLHTFNSNNGQLVWSQSLFIKDVVLELRNGLGKWDRIRILKALAIYDLYGLADCAAELVLEASRKQYITDQEQHEYLNLLTPQIISQQLSYAQYHGVKLLELVHFFVRKMNESERFNQVIDFKIFATDELATSNVVAKINEAVVLCAEFSLTPSDDWSNAFILRYTAMWKRYNNAIQEVVDNGWVSWISDRMIINKSYQLQTDDKLCK